MISAPVERSTASAAYSFVRFTGGAAAPYLAGKLGESNMNVPFRVGAACTALAIAVRATGRKVLANVDDHEPLPHSVDEARAVTVGDRFTFIRRPFATGEIMHLGRCVAPANPLIT